MSNTAELAARLTEAARHETVLDVGVERIAQVYADALLRAAERQGVGDEVLAEFDGLLSELYRDCPELEVFLASSAVERAKKGEAIQRAFGGRSSTVFVNFLLVLNDHERLGLLRPIADAFCKLRDKRAGRVRVQVRTAVALNNDQLESLRAELRTRFKLDPQLTTSVDPELLGGLIVQVGDQLFDGSVRTQLANIRNQLIARSSHEIQSGRDRFSSPGGD